MLLYHGTAARHLPAILREGIKPRGKGTGNWKRTIESNADCVYLTNAYVLHFAGNASKDAGDLAVIEVDTAKLDPFRMQPDEDCLEQASRKVGPAPLDKDMKFRTRWYRKRLSEFGHLWTQSVEGLGTCNYRGTIPPEAITRYVTIPHNAYLTMLFAGVDPVIHILNYQIMGATYRNVVHWLFGDPLEPDSLQDQRRAATKALEALHPGSGASGPYLLDMPAHGLGVRLWEPSVLDWEGAARA